MRMMSELMWGLEDCECGAGRPPVFQLPPPPRPTFLSQSLSDCSEAPILDLETCALHVIDAEYHSSPALPSFTLILVCSAILLAMLLLVSIVVWKHKKKMQNFIPCKSSPQNHCEISHGNGVIYEDLTNIRPRALPQSVEMLDVKLRGADITYHSPMFICPPTNQSHYCSQDQYNPVYEELSNGSLDRGESESDYGRDMSEDEFVENDGIEQHRTFNGPQWASLRNQATADDNCERVRSHNGRHGSLPSHNEHRSCRGRSHTVDRSKTSDRRRQPPVSTPPCRDLHEELLLDALLQLYPNRSLGSQTHLPYILPLPSPLYESVINHYPSRQELTTFRPSQQDSDSGYSQNIQ